jgi:hypothetical protein
VCRHEGTHRGALLMLVTAGAGMASNIGVGKWTSRELGGRCSEPSGPLYTAMNTVANRHAKVGHGVTENGP